MSDKKYELTDETIEVDGFTLYRIRALRDFGWYRKKGDLGGYIATEENLSHDGLAWVDDNARVYGNAYVYENAFVCDNACVCGNAHVCNNAHIGGNACVCDDAWVFGSAWVINNAYICNDACIYNNARIYDNARVSSAKIYSDAQIGSNAIIEDTEDYMMFGPFGSRNATTTIYHTANGAQVVCGCFRGTLSSFRDMVKHTHGNNHYAKEYLAIADIAEMRFGKGEEN